MAEILKMLHGVGPAGLSGLSQRQYPLPISQNALGSGSTFGRFSLSRFDPLPNSTTPTSPIPILTAVTGSGSDQSVNVSYTGDMVVGDYWVCEPGTALQEVFAMSNPTDSSHVLVTLQNSHAVGALMYKVHSIVTRYLIPSLTAVGTPLSNFNFIRFSSLPANVFDHYIINGSSGVFDYVVDDVVPWVKGLLGVSAIPLIVPQYDPSLVSSTGNPTNGIVLEAGSITSSGAIYPQPRVQLLVTTVPEPNFNIDYCAWWDN